MKPPTVHALPPGDHFFPLSGRPPCPKCGAAYGVELSLGSTGFSVGADFNHPDTCPSRQCDHGIPWNQDCPTCEAIVAGVGTLDGVITTTLGAAGLEHDAAVDFACGRLESSSRRAAMWAGRIAGERALVA